MARLSGSLIYKFTLTGRLTRVHRNRIIEFFFFFFFLLDAAIVHPERPGPAGFGMGRGH